MKADKPDSLESIREQLKKCVKCGARRANCPAFSVFGRETSVARGKVALTQHLLKGDVALDDDLYKAMSSVCCAAVVWRNAPTTCPQMRLWLLPGLPWRKNAA